MRDAKHQPENKFDCAYDTGYDITRAEPNEGGPNLTLSPTPSGVESKNNKPEENITNTKKPIKNDIYNIAAPMKRIIYINTTPINRVIYANTSKQNNMTANETRTNSLPNIDRLESDSSDSQNPGSVVRWKAYAHDPDGDQIYYKFLLKGPSTNGILKLQRDWSTSPTWSWITDERDIGLNLIQVQIIDGKHAGPRSCDVSYSKTFEIASIHNDNYTIEECRQDLSDKQINYTAIKNEVGIPGTTNNWVGDTTKDRSIIYIKMYSLQSCNSEYMMKITLDDFNNPMDVEFTKDSEQVSSIPEQVANQAMGKLRYFYI